MTAAYDLLAEHYDAVTGDCATEAALIRRLIERRHRRAGTVLDVACGTGGITALLASAYRYQVSGLDISPGMLAVARRKLPAGTPLYLADMTRFALGATFDAVVCAYQGVNHLLSFAAWESFFDRAREHLGDGGVLVFDITTVGQLAAMAGIPEMTQQFGDNYLLTRVTTTNGTVFDWRIEVFELQPDGRYRLLAQTVKTRSFPLVRIREALSRRFADVETLTGEEDRTWFVCGRA
jgi:cyclopropane fatty-acyl-phospholipid synthase-like methyltransferase